MKKFLIFLAIVLLIGTGYFTYDKWVKHSDLSLWSFVPNNAIAIYESDSPLSVLEEIKESKVWKNLSYIRSIANIEESINILDTLAGQGNFKTFFKENPALIALNVTSSKTFDFLYIVEIKNLSQQSFISKAQAYFNDKDYTKRTRIYEGFTITELINGETNQSFTYIFYKNYFIGSFSAFLVEDAIRTVGADSEFGFQAYNPELRTLTKLEQDQGNLYLNMKRVVSLINVASESSYTFSLAKNSFVDLKVTDDLINLTGFTFLDDPDQFLSSFANSNGASFDMAEIIPNNTSWFYHFSSENMVELGSKMNEYHLKKDPQVIAHQQLLLKENDFDVNQTYNLLDEEIGLLTLESSVTGRKNQLFILEMNDMGEALRFFNSVGERKMQKTGDTLYHEQYGDYEIRKLPVPEFPYALLGSVASGFSESFYLQFRNYLIFSNSLQQLKNLTFSIEDEATWTKSIRINRFLSRTNKEANFSFFVNTPRAWNQLLKSLKPEWVDIFDEFQFSLKNLEFLAFQFSAVDDKFYTNINVYQPDLPNRTIPERINTIHSLTLADYITTKPFLVINHDDKSREVFIQDTTNSVYLIDKSFNVLWDLPIDEPIKGDVRQIDYYNNGKMQYLFTTKSGVHIVDRTGKYIPEFPKKLVDNKPINHFNVIDYDNSKRYRFAITDENGAVYLTDKNLKPLEGWNPRKFNSPLAQAPVHRRINGKDVIIVLQTNGKLWQLSRRGENYPGFPKDVESNITNPMFIKNANSLEDATISLLTNSGEIIEIAMDGDLVRRDQLYKPGTETKFKLMPDVTGDTYVILRQTGTRYEVLDATGETLFEKDYFTKSELITQYYQLGRGIEFIIFVDPGGSFLYMYDRNGNLATGRPLASSCPISIMQYENEFQIYRAVDRNLELISVSF
ncbi:MAG: hypothetical protein RIC35_24990 [Marinoscillum sp.]